DETAETQPIAKSEMIRDNSELKQHIIAEELSILGISFREYFSVSDGA
ncbi:11306_t:CDS:2, partial [Acaulospora colombiana]